MEELGICAGLGVCQFCIVVNFTARGLVPHIEKFNLKLLRTELSVGFYNEYRSPSGSTHSLRLNVEEYRKSESPIEGFGEGTGTGPESDWQILEDGPDFYLFQGDEGMFVSS